MSFLKSKQPKHIPSLFSNYYYLMIKVLYLQGRKWPLYHRFKVQDLQCKKGVVIFPDSKKWASSKELVSWKHEITLLCYFKRYNHKYLFPISLELRSKLECSSVVSLCVWSPQLWFLFGPQLSMLYYFYNEGQTKVIIKPVTGHQCGGGCKDCWLSHMPCFPFFLSTELLYF